MNGVTPAQRSKSQERQRLLRRLIWKLPIIILLVSFAIWWEWRKEQGGSSNIEPASVAFTGSWVGDVSYGSGASHKELFFFQPEGNKLFGTASVLGAKRGIEEGKIEGESIAFFVRYEEMNGGERRQRKNYYWGRLNGSEILMRLQDDRGNPPVDFVLRKSNSSQ